MWWDTANLHWLTAQKNPSCFAEARFYWTHPIIVLQTVFAWLGVNFVLASKRYCVNKPCVLDHPLLCSCTLLHAWQIFMCTEYDKRCCPLVHSIFLANSQILSTMQTFLSLTWSIFSSIPTEKYVLIIGICRLNILQLLNMLNCSICKYVAKICKNVRCVHHFIIWKHIF